VRTLRQDGARHLPQGAIKNRNFAYYACHETGMYAALQQVFRRAVMSVDQLFGKYRRLKKDLSAAYSQPQVERGARRPLVDEIGQVEQELALHAPIGLHAPQDERGRPRRRELGPASARLALAPRSLIVAAPEIRRCTCGVPQ
jgi:hypothetical protein